MGRTNKLKPLLTSVLFISLFLIPGLSLSADLQLPGVTVTLSGAHGAAHTATAFKLLLMLTVLSIAPALLILVTSFTRIVIVLSMLRHALGMQQTPPNTVLISLALLLTIFNMSPVFESINTNAFQPYMSGKLNSTQAFKKAMKPLRMFMIRQTNEKDMAVILEINHMKPPDNVDDIGNIYLISAYILSELKTAFEIGFVIFLPFLLVDLVVASILMAMGMIMVPPMMISLPLKILMFVLIDGWVLVVQALMGSFS